MLRLAEPTPSPPVTAKIVAAKRPLRVCKPPLGADNAPPADPGNDALPPEPVERIVSHLDADGGQWIVSAARPTPDEVEAIAQRLAALFLRGA